MLAPLGSASSSSRQREPGPKPASGGSRRAHGGQQRLTEQRPGLVILVVAIHLPGVRLGRLGLGPPETPEGRLGPGPILEREALAPVDAGRGGPGPPTASSQGRRGRCRLLLLLLQACRWLVRSTMGSKSGKINKN